MIEGILPECYFTNNLRGLSVDMAVFRDLLKLRSDLKEFRMIHIN